MSYKELQSALKNYRNNGVVLQVKLNATKAALQAEYNRITGNSDSKQQTQEMDELQMLRDELAAAKATIAKQAARIQELESAQTQQQPEPEPEQQAPKVEYNANSEAQADVIAQEVIEIQREKGKKAAAKHIKRNLPKFHPDTCKQYGNVYCEATWHRLNTLIEWLEVDSVYNEYFS